MDKYLRVEIDGEAAECGALIAELRETDFQVFIDSEGFLLVPEQMWGELSGMAERYGCELSYPEWSLQAA